MSIFKPANKSELKTAINAWIADKPSALSTYGDINSWNTSDVTDMSSLFLFKSNFNDNISGWDTSNVTDMKNMFQFAGSFNRDIGSWDVSNVTDMKNMFQNSTFNQDIGSWDVSKVRNMSFMFSGASMFDQVISNWDVSSVIDMSYMFSSAMNFKQDIGNWNVSNVTNMRNMFNNARFFNQDIGSWDVSNVTSMESMFNNAQRFNKNISNWGTSSVTSMKSMFQMAYAFNQDISNWNVSNVTSMESMFYSANNFNQDLSNWDVSNVTNFSNMFAYANEWNYQLPSWIQSVFASGVNNDGMLYMSKIYKDEGAAGNSTDLADLLLCFHKDTELLCYNQDTKEEYYKRCEDICVGDYLKTFGTKNKYSKVKYHKITKANNLLNNPLNVMYQHKVHKDIVVTGKHGVIYLKSEVNDSPIWKRPLPEIKDIVVKRAYQDNNFTLFKDEEESDVHVLCVEYENDDQSVGLFMKHGLASESCSERWIKTI